MAHDSDDDTPRLSEHALAALREFYEEQRAMEEKPSENITGKVSFQENWQLSQFWYNDCTAAALANECLYKCPSGRIACLSCPSLFAKLLEVKPSGCEVMLFEFDKRFAAYGDSFCYYDYKQPLDIPTSLQDHFDFVAADPPFLSEECLSKVSETVKFLTSKNVLLCTGAVMLDLAERYLGVVRCAFVPRHKKNLANEFSCYVNYEESSLK